MAAAYRARLAKFEDVLKQDKINLEEFQRECFNGIPDNPGIRSICWKILLNYLPPKRTLWKELLSERRSAYKQFLQEMIIKPGCSMDNACSDHPPIVIPPHKLNKEDQLNCVVNAEIKSMKKEDWPDFKFRDFVAALKISTPTRKRREANSNITADDVMYVESTPQQFGDDLETQFIVASGSSYVPGSTLTDQLHKNREQIKSEVGIVLGALSVGIPEIKEPDTGKNSSSSSKNSDIFIVVITIACVSLVILSIGLIYIVCDRRRARRGEYITESTVEEDGGYDNPLMNEKKSTNGNGAHLISMKVDTAMVPMEEQANGDKGKFEVEDTHL